MSRWNWLVLGIPGALLAAFGFVLFVFGRPGGIVPFVFGMTLLIGAEHMFALTRQWDHDAAIAYSAEQGEAT